MRLPHPASRQTRMTLFDTLSPIALWHAGRIKGGIFHMQLELKIRAMMCGAQRKAGGSQGCNERWLEVEAPASELHRAAETNSSCLGIEDAIRHYQSWWWQTAGGRQTWLRATQHARVRKRKGVFVGTLPATIKDIQRVLKHLFLGHVFTEDRQNFFQGCVPMILQNSIDKLFTGGTNKLLSEVLLCLFFVFQWIFFQHIVEPVWTMLWSYNLTCQVGCFLNHFDLAHMSI